MKISLFCRPHQLPGGDPTLFAEAARLADEAGLHSIHLGEHVVMGDRTDRYPFGEFKHETDTPWLEPLLVLATAASVTSRLRFSTGILLAPLRSGPMMAKQLATLDVLTSGRLEPGVGIGWQREEFSVSGVPWAERYARLDANMRACRRLWGEQPVQLEGADGVTHEVSAWPVPVQSRMPILLGLAPTPANIQRIVEYADGWCPVRLTPPQLAEGVSAIRAAFVQAGRDPESLIVRTQAQLVLHTDGRIDVPATLAIGHDYAKAGATVLAVGPTQGCASMADVADLIHELATVSARLAPNDEEQHD